jgi:hypothetical protein
MDGSFTDAYWRADQVQRGDVWPAGQHGRQPHGSTLFAH